MNKIEAVRDVLESALKDKKLSVYNLDDAKKKDLQYVLEKVIDALGYNVKGII